MTDVLLTVLCGVCGEPLGEDVSVWLDDHIPPLMCLDCATALVGEEKARASTMQKRLEKQAAEILRKH